MYIRVPFLFSHRQNSLLEKQHKVSSFLSSLVSLYCFSLVSSLYSYGSIHFLSPNSSSSNKKSMVKSLASSPPPPPILSFRLIASPYSFCFPCFLQLVVSASLPTRALCIHHSVPLGPSPLLSSVHLLRPPLPPVRPVFSNASGSHYKHFQRPQRR